MFAANANEHRIEHNVDDAIARAAHLSIGRLGVKQAQVALRIEMFREALRRSNGNRQAAARLLGVDRRYVLKMLKEHPGIAL